jgi:hypothetical protein
MIDITKLPKATSQVKVEPSDELFRELGNNTYDFKDLLSELILEVIGIVSKLAK